MGFLKTMHQLSTTNTLKILKKYKIPFAKSILCRSLSETKNAAKKLGFPIVMKISSPEIIHKSDCGGVITDIKNISETKEAFLKILKNVSSKCSKDSIEGVLLSKYVKGYQLMIGAKKDPQFGPLVIFGMGGIYVEVFKDIAMHIGRISHNEAKKLIASTKVYKILSGIRGQEKANLEAIASVLVKVSILIEKEKEIAEVDFNPVIANKKEAIVVDARLMSENEQ